MEFAKLISREHDWLIRRLKLNMENHGFDGNSSMLGDSLQTCLAGLANAPDSFRDELSDQAQFNPKAAYATDSVARFVINEANKQRELGLDLSDFLYGLKILRQTFLGLGPEYLSPDEDAVYRNVIERSFDRAEIGLTAHWVSQSRKSALHDIEVVNPAEAGERNKYLTLFESLHSPLFLLDGQNGIEKINRAAAEFVENSIIKNGDCGPGIFYDLQDAAKTKRVKANQLLPWLDPDLDLFLKGNEFERFLEKTVTIGDKTRHYEVGLMRMHDQNGDLSGYILNVNDVTVNRNAEKALKQSEVRFRQIYENVPIMIHSIDSSGVIRNANVHWLSELGYTRDEVIGRNIEFIMTAESKVLFRTILPTFWSDGKISDVGYQYIRKDGSVRDVLLNSVAVYDPVWGMLSLSVVRDITERKTAREELLRAKEVWERTFDAVPDLIAILDDEFRIVKANKSMIEKLESSPEEIIGCNCFSLVHDTKEPPYFCPHAKLLKDACTHSTEISESKLNGIFSVTCSPIYDEKRKLLGSVHIATDITERKKAEQLLVQSERLKAIGELATGVAHNFNNLLQIIMGGAQLAGVNLEIGDIDEAKAQIDEILDSARFGSETVKRLQSFARVRFEQSPKGSEVFDLSATVNQAVEMSKIWWKTVPEKEGTLVTLEQVLTADCRIKGSESELFEVIVNLVKNAVEAMPLGGKIIIKTFRDRCNAVLQISDTGIGISMENKAKIFEPFFTTKGFQSTGMGLASSYGIVQSHHGEISCESEPGRGTVFTVKIPLIENADASLNGSYDKTFRARLKILVVDDMPPVTRILAHGLGKFNQTVLTAASGSEALDIVKKEPVDIVICDLGMPNMNGWEVGKRMKQLREQQGMAKIPFIMLTGWGGQVEELQKITESGVDKILEKPVDMPMLIEAIKEIGETTIRQLYD